MAKVVNRVTTRFVYDNEDIVGEVDAANAVTALYIHGPGIDEPLAIGRPTGTFVYHADGLGSITHLTSNTGAVTRTYTYDSFGRIVAQTGALANPYTYTGRELDPESGLYYYRARYYDPTLGRFLQQDPIRFLGGINFYSYVENDPLSFRDPWGLLNPAKAVSSMLNSANAGRLYAEGSLRIAAAAGLTGTGVAAPAGTGTALLGFWNIYSATKAQKRAVQQWREALEESWTDARWRNLLGVLPFGERFDDPCEPTLSEFLSQKYERATGSLSDIVEFMQEFGSLFP
jgi:type VI secretion system secreted protein VgrG